MFKDKYLAFVLTNQCRETILSLYPKRYETIQCHHVTLQYDILGDSQEDLNKVLSYFEGKEFKLNGFIEADGIDLFRVVVDDKARRLDGRFYHLTHTHRLDRKASDSNLVFSAEIKNYGMVSASMKLYGKVQLVTKS